MRIILVKPGCYQLYHRSGMITAVCGVIVLLLGFTNLDGGPLLLAALFATFSYPRWTA